MANNRMFLVYRPTGDAVPLGRRMGWGWYGAPPDLAERVEELFRKAEEAAGGEVSQDDFAIALESGEHQPHVIDKWNYVSSGPVEKIEIDQTVPHGKPERI